MEAFRNGAGLGIPSAFALIGSPGSFSPCYQLVGMATASGKKETSFNQHILQSQCSALDLTGD